MLNGSGCSLKIFQPKILDFQLRAIPKEDDREVWISLREEDTQQPVAPYGTSHVLEPTTISEPTASGEASNETGWRSKTNQRHPHRTARVMVLGHEMNGLSIKPWLSVRQLQMHRPKIWDFQLRAIPKKKMMDLEVRISPTAKDVSLFNYAFK